jgi:hypothetical protein
VIAPQRTPMTQAKMRSKIRITPRNIIILIL